MICRHTSGLASDAWGVLLEQTKKKSASRAQFATQLLEEVKPRVDHMEQESVATAKKATEIIQALQLEMQCVFKSTDESLKTYHSCQVIFIIVLSRNLFPAMFPLHAHCCTG
jgi:hypothetical protein